MLLRHLIALMIHVRHSRKGRSGRIGPWQTKKQTIRKTVFGSLRRHACQTHPASEAADAQHRKSSKAVAGACRKAPATGHVPSSRCQTSAPRPTMSSRRIREVFDSTRTATGSRQPSRHGGARRDRTDDLKLAKLRALPTELWPLEARLASGRAASAWSDGAAPSPARPTLAAPPIMVGLGRLERPTSPLSGVRSNHLSYRPGPSPAAAQTASQAKRTPQPCSAKSD